METALYSKLHHDEDENVEAAAPRHERPSRARDRKFYQLICILLLISNLCVVGLWQRSLQEVQRCVGPKLVYCRFTARCQWRSADQISVSQHRRKTQSATKRKRYGAT